VKKVDTTHYPIALEELPPLWSSTTVGDVLSDIQPGFVSGVHNQEGVGIPHLRPMNVDRDGKLDLTVVKYVSGSNPLRVEIGDVLFNNTNSAELIGKTAHIGIEGDFAFSNHMTRLRPAAGVDPRFTAYQLHFLWMAGYFQHRCTHHVNQASIASTTLAETVPFAVAPSDEQRRIAEEIEKQFTRLDVAIAALRRVQTNLKRYRAAVLKAAFEGRLVPTDAELARRESHSYESASILLERILRERQVRWQRMQSSDSAKSKKLQGVEKRKGQNEHVVAPDESALPRLPEGWCWVSLGQIFDVYVGATPSRGKTEYWGGKIPWVSSGEVAFCRITKTRESITELGLKHTSTLVHPPGTVLLGMIGEGKTRGQAAILDIPACNNQNSAAIRVSETPIPSEFVYRFLEGEYERTRRRSSGGNQPALNKERVRAIPMPLPPFSEIQRIVAELERCCSLIDQLEKQVTANLEKAKHLRQSVLQVAFEGKLVPQDPSDEPATLLLDRISSARLQARQMKGDIPKMPRPRGTKRLSIVEVLRSAKSGMTPEALLSTTGHNSDSIDEFYAELKAQTEAGLVEEIRSGEKIIIRSADR
jgi:type I restriction enzyme S subunit